MKCPRCKTQDLKPAIIEEHLPALGCPGCEGSLVSLVYYRHWAETQKPPAEAGVDDITLSIETSDTTNAIMCPKCSRVMMKYKLTGTISNRLDVCALCEEAWLDRGEWQLLQALQLSHVMPTIFTETWQRRIRHELIEDRRLSLLVQMIGEPGVARVDEFRTWLIDNEHKLDIVAYLNRA